jgi:hypothetical protein
MYPRDDRWWRSLDLVDKVGPLRFLMSTGMEHSGEGNHGRSTEVVNDMICAPYLILDVEMELL